MSRRPARGGSRRTRRSTLSVPFLAALAAHSGLGIVAPRPSAAGEPGTAGANFLHIGAGPRAIGMGEAHAAVVDDAYAAYWNPAALSQVRFSQAALMYNQLYQGLNEQFLSYAHPIFAGGAAAASLTRLDMGAIDGFDANGAARGSVAAGDLAAAISYGQTLELPFVRPPQLSVGLTGQWIREQLAFAKASTYVGDVGLLLTHWENLLGDNAQGLKFAVVGRHIGPGLKYYSASAPMPRTYSVGLALERRPWGDPVTLALDFRKPVDDGPAVSMGLEYWVHGLLAVRGGYITGQSEGLGLRVGLGLRLKRVQLDYAFAGFGALGNAHRFGVNYRFSGEPDLGEKRPEDFISQGKSYMAQHRYYEAVNEFNRALSLDPANPVALDLLRQSLRAMEPPAPPQKEQVSPAQPQAAPVLQETRPETTPPRQPEPGRGPEKDHAP